MKLSPFSNTFGEQCPICGTGSPEEATLIMIAGTEVGNRAEVCQVHTTRLLENLWYYKNSLIVAKATHPIKKP